ncbi:MAG: type II CAAX prenyl endopeptidase Rce1 family protein, partial [Nannocystaceae bacterium]
EYAPPRGSFRLTEHFSVRQNSLTSALLVFPLFLTYQIGILLRGGSGLNGVDYITSSLIELCARDLDTYLLTLACLLVAYGSLLLILRSRGVFRAESFVPTILEAGFYATTMGTLILLVIHQVSVLLPSPTLAIGSYDLGDVLVISAGAGLHEELLFRLLGMGGLGWLLSGLFGKREAWVLAFLLSSLAFSLAHHVGAGAEAFTMAAFVYRFLAGMFFAVVYHLRGFGVAAWAHALYDLYVLSLF